MVEEVQVDLTTLDQVEVEQDQLVLDLQMEDILQ
jgi:hypothetical protein